MLIPFAIDINLFYRFSFVFFVLFKKQKRPPKRTAVIFEPPNPKDTGLRQLNHVAWVDHACRCLSV